jgi:beta-glucosidase
MNLYKNLTVILAAACYLMIIIPGQASVIKTSAVKQSCATDIKMHPAEKDSQNVGFIWPEGIKAGVSLTFDDARLSQIDKGIPLLDKHGVKATFYVSPLQMMKRIEKWKEAVANGHEIGNHSLTHPCSGNFPFARNNALENYTLEEIQMELDSAGRFIRKNAGITPVSFAYPCGQTFAGRGLYLKSYIPLVAASFESGRLWMSEGPNDPEYSDLHQLYGVELDGKSFKEALVLIQKAAENGQWLIFAGHETDYEGKRQTTLLSTLDSICIYATDPANGIWIDNVHNVASYIKQKRGEKPFSALPLYKNPAYPVDRRVEDLLSRMTIEEKTGQLNAPVPYKMSSEPNGRIDACRKFAAGNLLEGIGPAGGFWAPARMFNEGAGAQAGFLNELQKIATENTRLQIPLLFFEEGTHGLMTAGGTIFPEGMALGSAWNNKMISDVYATAAREARTRGVHFLGTLVIEPVRDPRLGRNEEGYSEDPYLCSQIAEAIVTGMQGNDISANDKAIALLCHFPGQSEPVSGLERGEMEISERKLREVFLKPWISGIKKCGALGVMATYPAIDRESAHGSEKLLTKILREELNFRGLVMSEGAGLGILIYEQIVSDMKEAGELCLKAGVDVSIWFEDGYLQSLKENLNEGKVSVETIDRAVRRILKVKFMLGLFENPYVDVEQAVRESNTDQNRKLALESAREGIVLLKNEKNLLPLSKNIRSVAVIGPNADNEINQLGDYTHTPIIQDIITPLEGIRNKVSSDTRVTFVQGCNIIDDDLNEIEEAVAAAKNADVAIIVAGESHSGKKTNGEGFDVASLDLTGKQEELIRAVHKTGTPAVVVLINGRPLSIRWTAENIPAVVEAWNCGEQGGNAIADVLFGDYNPSGKLPVTVPRHVGQLPVYYNHMPSKEYWISQRGGYADMPATPLWEFGYGLSYTTFEYSNLNISPAVTGSSGEITVSLDIRNNGSRSGHEVIQLYLNDMISSVTSPVKELKGFQKVFLNPGEKTKVHFLLTPEHTALLDKNMQWVTEPGRFEVMVGSSSKDIRLTGYFDIQ